MSKRNQTFAHTQTLLTHRRNASISSPYECRNSGYQCPHPLIGDRRSRIHFHVTGALELFEDENVRHAAAGLNQRRCDDVSEPTFSTLASGRDKKRAAAALAFLPPRELAGTARERVVAARESSLMESAHPTSRLSPPAAWPFQAPFRQPDCGGGGGCIEGGADDFALHVRAMSFFLRPFLNHKHDKARTSRFTVMEFR